MRAPILECLVLTTVLCAPACDDDWALVGRELERTVDEVGDALAVLDPCPCPARAGRVGRRAAGLEARLGERGWWARPVRKATRRL